MFLIGIAGGSASGKTFVAKSIGKYLDENKISNLIISQDNFYKGLTEHDDSSTYNFDHPDAIDFDELISVVSELKKGNNVNVPKYCFETHKRNGYTNINSANVIIVDGILIFTNENLRKLFDLKIFVEASHETRLLRRIKRDQEERGRSLDSIYLQYMKFVKPAYENIIKPTIIYSDLTIHNEQGMNFIGLKIICTFIQKLFQDKSFFEVFE